MVQASSPQTKDTAPPEACQYARALGRLQDRFNEVWAERHDLLEALKLIASRRGHQRPQVIARDAITQAEAEPQQS